MSMQEWLETPPYSLSSEEKRERLNLQLRELTRSHYERCGLYRRFVDVSGFDIHLDFSYDEIPFLPVRLFKEYDLKSVRDEEVVKTLTSSGTTGQRVSKIYLDKETSSNQTKCLVKIVSSFLGGHRVPMLILDSSAVIKNRQMFSARGAGILGFSMFGTKRCYALDENMELDIDSMKSFLEQHQGETIFLFGFTFMIWQHFYKKLLVSGYRPDLSNGVLIHGGGWKKLVNEQVSPEDFKKALNTVCGIQEKNVHDYYGMVEQTGSIYMECECGHLHTSVFSDVLIRRPKDFSLADKGERGLIEVVSILPHSYPGHVLLTEDEGMIEGEDDCPCGRKGKYFKIFGRIKNAEIRGCSDTYASNFK
jgi:phenylacetate-coenzyme A ligase PaaK-like adenylate-forming protein